MASQFQTKLITGEEEESQMLAAFLPMYDILCLTPQILVNNLKSGNIKSLSQLSLLVLDECHHARGNDPYAVLMRMYLKEKEGKNSKGVKGMPQVVV